MSTTRLALLALSFSLLTGCASGNLFASKAPIKGDRERRKLKDPTKLDLAYAKWQEQIGNVTEARERYQRVISDNPQSVEALLGLARLDQVAGRTQEAEQSFRKALKAAPNNPQVLDGVGQFYVSQDKWPAAIDLLKQAQAAAPSDTAIRFHLGVALAKSGDIAAARPHFVATVGEAEADYNLGLIMHDQGKLDAAEQYFSQAITRKPALEEAQFWLGEVRTEKQTKTLLTGASARNRPDLQAPAGAIPTTTKFQQTNIVEQRLSPTEAFGIQQTGIQLPAGAPATVSTIPADPLPSGGWGSPFGANRSAPRNPTATRSTPWQTLMGGVSTQTATATPPNELSRQQLEQMQNQR